MRSIAFLSLVSVTLASACSNAPPVPDGSAQDSAASDAASDVAIVPDGATMMDAAASDGAVDAAAQDAATSDAAAGPCPATLPAARTACTRELLTCQYGGDPRENCRPSATCSMGFWTVTTPTCPPINPPNMCPATREMASGQACSPLDAVCAYDGLFCRCTNCRSFPVGGCNGPLLWQCNAPNPEMACPAVQPNLGAACAPEGQRCGYDCEAYGTNGGRLCQSGAWVASANNCPVSTRRAKRDIVYLSEREREQMSRDVLRTRLATYEYTDPALAGRRRLGFVYEDESTHRFARDPDISGVDLYGYTSLLLATVQTQQQQIEQLQREVRALRARR